MGALALTTFGNVAIADEPGSGHSSEVIPGEWDDDDPKINFNFKDIPTAKYSGLRLYLSCGLQEAKILYTTDSNATADDENAWSVYTQPLELTEDCTVRFFARCEGYNDSDIQEYVFVYADHQAAAPSVAPDMDRKNIVMVTDTPDATIRYTFDGSDPSESSTAYDGPFAIVANGTYKARSFASDLFPSAITEYTVDFLKAAMPSASFDHKHLVLSSSEPVSNVYYTFGDAPASDTNAWTLYSAPIALTEDCTVRYFASHEGYNDSEIGTFVFSYSAYQVAAPVLTANPEGTHVVMQCATEGAEIRYTTDGSEPTQQSSLYAAPVEITGNGTFHARAFADGLFDSNTVDFIVMHLAVPSPTAAFENKALVISCSDPKATIKYTFDAEATPDNSEAWLTYEAPLALTDNCTVRFFGCRENFNNSDIVGFTFTKADYMVEFPHIERSEDGRSIVMTTATEGAEIRYTTDGTDPTEESELYTEPIFITQNCTFRARAYAEGLFESAVSEYTVANMTMMTPHASFENLLLNLEVWDENASVWYTLDQEAAPEDEEKWTLYTEPIALDSDCTVRFFARRLGFLDSQIASYDFIYADWQAAAPEITEDRENNSIVITCETEGAVIRYTTDGTEPTEDSEIYTEPIEINGSMTIQARAFADALFASEISTLSVSGSSSVEAVNFDSLKVSKEDGYAVVYSDKAMTISIYSIAGQIVRMVEIEAGRNVIEDLDSNIYIIAGVRIKL